MTEGKGILGTSLQSKSVVDSIMDKIISAIIQGELSPGERLPTEMELCKTLEVGRNSVREAIKKLEAYGVVYIKRAEGTFVSENYNEKMLDPMLYGIILQKNCWEDFVQLRRVMDIGTLFVAAQSCTPTQLESIKEAVDALEQTMMAEDVSVDQVMEADTAVHTMIAKATGSSMLVTITDYVTRITLPSRIKTVENVLRKGNNRHFIELHRRLVEVLENKQLDQIEKVVLDHYVYWQEKK